MMLRSVFRAGPAAIGRALSSSAKVAVGSQFPMDLKFQTISNGKPTEVAASDVFADKKVVVFGVPGAFTPTCHAKHAPEFIETLPEFKAKGVDRVVCISVNDPFVLDAWAQALNTTDITFLADPAGDAAKRLGLDWSVPILGTRFKRFSMLVDHGEIKSLSVEDGGALTDASRACTILKKL